MKYYIDTIEALKKEVFLGLIPPEIFQNSSEFPSLRLQIRKTFNLKNSTEIVFIENSSKHPVDGGDKFTYQYYQTRIHLLNRFKWKELQL